jgi:hypothetical protein
MFFIEFFFECKMNIWNKGPTELRIHIKLAVFVITNLLGCDSLSDNFGSHEIL